MEGGRGLMAKIMGFMAWLSLGWRPMMNPRVIPAKAARKKPGIRSPIELISDSQRRGIASHNARIIRDGPGKSILSKYPVTSVASVYAAKIEAAITTVPP